MTATATPKYLAIADTLRERCLTLADGDRLPPERQLAAEFGVSLMTLRQALSELARAGWLERIVGRGTFVRRPTVAMGPGLTSFSEDMRRRQLTPSARLLGFDRVAADTEIAVELGVRPGEQVVEVERLRLADGEPMCHESSYLPGHLLATLEAADLEGSLHEALAAAGLTPMSANRRVRAVTAAPRECRLLDLPNGSPALEITDTFFDARERPIQTSRSRYRFDRYEVLGHLTRQPDEPQG